MWIETGFGDKENERKDLSLGTARSVANELETPILRASNIHYFTSSK
jgi:hypothetical protein